MCVSHGEIDAGRVGIAAPVFDRERTVLGSLSIALGEAHADASLIRRLAPLTTKGAREIERTMNSGSASTKPSPARVKLARPR